MLNGSDCNFCTWTSVAIIVVVLYTIWINWKNRKLPRHPFILPIVGNVLSIGKIQPFQKAMQLKDKNDKVARLVSFIIPFRPPMVFINDIQLVKQLFLSESDSTSNRPETMKEFLPGGMDFGIIASPPPKWIHSRRIGLQILRELGFGKGIIQRSIEEQCDYLKQVLNAHVDKGSFRITNIFSRCSSDIMSLMLFGRKPAIDGGKEVKYVEMMEEMMRSGSRFLMFLPFMKGIANLPILRDLIGEAKVVGIRESLTNYLLSEIEIHRSRLNSSDEPRDFIDHFILLQNKEKAKDGDGGVFTDENFTFILLDLFVAGTDTTSVTLSWAIALLCFKENVQEKVHQELTNVFGEGQNLNMNQLNECPYTRAVMSEVFRFGLTAPASLLHEMGKEIQIDDCKIPKNALLLANLFNIFRDANLWKRPYEFYPEHFYNAESNTFIPSDNLIPFSIGRRACLGESLARQEFFMFLATVLIRFRFEFDELSAGNVEEILAGNTSGVIRAPNEFKVKVFNR